jgi:hypothetical protein
MHNTPEECSCCPLHGRSLKSRRAPHILSLELKEMQVVMNFTVAEKGCNDPLDKQSEIVAEIYQPIEILII